MRRVLILGPPGAGKSTFARKLGARTGLPVIHLDAEFWQPGWIEPDKAAWAARVAELAAGDAWIIDGNYDAALGPRLARADTAIILDTGRLTCMARVIARTLRSFGRTRPDMREGCPERFDLDFLKYVWRFPTERRPRLVEALRTFDGDVIWCESERDLGTLLRQVKAAAG